MPPGSVGKKVPQCRQQHFFDSRGNTGGRVGIVRPDLRSVLSQQFMGREIAPGSVMFVETVHSDAFNRSPGCLGESSTKLGVSLVGYAEPVDRADDDRLVWSNKHDASAPVPSTR